jgi:hypothetical protein
VDIEAWGPGDVAGYLRDLARFNRYLGGASALLRPLTRLIEADFPDPRAPFTVLDVGTGGGDLPRALCAWARKRGRRLQVLGLDRQKEILRWALGRSGGFREITFIGADARWLPCSDRGFDYVTASLFLHHFSFEEAAALLGRFASSARLAVLINDPRRALLPYLLVLLLTRLGTRSRLTRHDAPLSLLRAFTVEEMEGLARAAGLGAWRLERAFPYRLVLVARLGERA